MSAFSAGGTCGVLEPSRSVLSFRLALCVLVLCAEIKQF